MVGTAPDCNQRKISGWDSTIPEIDFYFFPKVKLNSTMIIQHLGGVGLRAFFDDCSLKIPEPVEHLRYVHGHSEKPIRGQPYIHSVLLAHFPIPKPWKELWWLGQVPSLWQTFQKINK